MRLKRERAIEILLKDLLSITYFSAHLTIILNDFINFSHIFTLIFLIYETISLKIILRSYHLYFIHIRLKFMLFII